ncbi:hypothetical protein CEB3_c46100 [Peptococcaceae bacterium CEB3]|nr:hypothetical protein CEB3_c46100 [Peptococcaceae bacterium CEB3]
MEQGATQTPPVFSPGEPPAGLKDRLKQLPDPVNYLSTAMEIFVPVSKDGSITMLGLWFDAVGLLHIYVQQAIVPDNIFTQVRIITLRLPIALGFTVFNLGLALFFVRAFVLGFRAAVSETAHKFQDLMGKEKAAPAR